MKPLCFGRLSVGPFALVVALAAATQPLPYNPTCLLLSPAHHDLLYVFKPSSDGSTDFELGLFNLSSSLDASSLPYTTIDSALPFLDGGAKAFIPAVDRNGAIQVYSGNCSLDSGDATFWQYTLTSEDKTGTGKWSQLSLALSATTGSATAGASFLASGISFSSLVGDNSSSSLYVFGGMCPGDLKATAETWQSAANYSNTMVSLTPTGAEGSATYSSQVMSSRGAPVAEAGYALCPLDPTFSNDTNGLQTQQQSFVLIGGHTQYAFLNMSTIALFSLPQGSWAFLPVQQPTGQRTDLAVRTDVTEIEPRSGHTAVLSSDGQRIVIYGGWVGDVNTPANPQLAILNVGSGYGGQGSWAWMAPSPSGNGPSGDGIYGHGAIMLPGNVMMISGGYIISASTTKRKPRDAKAQSTKAFFYNLTSNSWVTSYSLPTSGASSTASSKGSGPLSKASQKAGLGIGLGVGAAVVIGSALFYLWYKRKHRRQSAYREDELRRLALGQDHEQATGNSNDGAGAMLDGRRGSVTLYDADSEKESQTWGWKRAQGRSAERTGLLVEIPSPTRGLRPGFGGKVQTQNGYRYEDVPQVMSPGGMNPIDEREEEEAESPHSKKSIRHEVTKSTSTIGESVALLASQRPGPLTSHPVHPTSAPMSGIRRALVASPARQSVIYSSNWTDDYEKEIAIGNLSSGSSAGRTSPSKSDRTVSDLSERSVRSFYSPQSGRSSATGNINRVHSLRSVGRPVNPQDPFMTPESSPTKDKAPDLYRSQSVKSTSSHGLHANSVKGDGDRTDSFSTARTSFIRLQAEGEALLGGKPERPEQQQHRPVEDAHLIDDGDIEPNTAREPTKSWIGSVRRALSRTRGSSAGSRTQTMSSFAGSFTNSTEPTEASSSSAMRHSGASLLGASGKDPKVGIQRSASDASFWMPSKRGARDWGIGPNGIEDLSGRWRRNSGDDWGSPEDRERERQRQKEAEDEWDVERAAEGRDVQVVFTVPKRRLRIVNAEPEILSLMSVDSDGENATDERRKLKSQRSQVLRGKEKAIGEGQYA